MRSFYYILLIILNVTKSHVTEYRVGGNRATCSGQIKQLVGANKAVAFC